jgi:RNA polymerase sigma factor (sigma-70 family)
MSQATCSSHQSDPELVRACLDGEESAWKELVARYSRLVYSIPLRYGLSASDADDVFQNVFLIVHRRLSTLKNQDLLAPWLITVTHREAKRLCKKLPPFAELDDSLSDGADPPQDQVERWERQHLVHLALAQMEPRCRDILTTLFLDSTPTSYEILSARLGITAGSIGPTRARCFKKLRAILLAMGVDLST